jgi:hypothetical protein
MKRINTMTIVVVVVMGLGGSLANSKANSKAKQVKLNLDARRDMCLIAGEK